MPEQARAVLYLGWDLPAQVVEVTVGPLPTPTNYTLLRSVPWNTRPPNSPEYSMCARLALRLSMLF